MLTLIILAVIVLLPLIAIIVLLSFPGKIVFRKRQLIPAKLADVYSTVADFGKQAQWSPWIVHEPDAQIQIENSQDIKDQYFSWQGRLIGSGKISNIRLKNNVFIERRIDFIKPFRTQAIERFSFQMAGRDTKVVWSFSSKLPFFLRFMGPYLYKNLSNDYQIGLSRLEMLLNPKSAQYKIEFLGPTTVPAMTYLYKPYTIALKSLPKERQLIFDDFKKLLQDIKEDIELLDINHFSILHKIDKIKKVIRFDYCVPAKLINPNSKKIPADVNFIEQDKYRAHLTRFSGDISKLGEALELESIHCRLTKNTFGVAVESYQSVDYKNTVINIYRRLTS